MVDTVSTNYSTVHYYIGTGVGVHTFTLEPPTERTDGSRLLPEEISGYRMFISYNGEPPIDMFAGVTPIPGTNRVQFNEVIDIDSHAPGSYRFWFRTVTVTGMESADSAVLEMILDPKPAAPLPPLVHGW